MRTDELDFDLPGELIAQEPAARRSDARLLHYVRATGVIAHRGVADFPRLLRRGDLLVLNDAKVLPARVELVKATGGRIEGLFLAEAAADRWVMLLRDVGNLAAGAELAVEGDASVRLRLVEKRQLGEWVVSPVRLAEPAGEFLRRVGRMPLPPYIRRDRRDDPRSPMDRDRYQTVYAASPGSVAAPTAGLHFTPEILAELDAMGIERTLVTLHVGLGTFRPVTAQRLEDHVMHAERFEISEQAAAALNAAKAEGRRIVAVGTTAARVLESCSEERFAAASGETSLFIYPPYRWRHGGALLTNFHLPRSTLIALVAALVGLEEQRRIYAAAIAERYRFFSYGDAMFIE